MCDSGLEMERLWFGSGLEMQKLMSGDDDRPKSAM